jgi:hypothetical protein
MESFTLGRRSLQPFSRPAQSNGSNYLRFSRISDHAAGLPSTGPCKPQTRRDILVPNWRQNTPRLTTNKVTLEGKPKPPLTVRNFERGSEVHQMLRREGNAEARKEPVWPCTSLRLALLSKVFRPAGGTKFKQQCHRLQRIRQVRSG